MIPLPLLAPSGGMAKDEAADVSRGGLTAELLAGWLQWRAVWRRLVWTFIPAFPISRQSGMIRSASGQLVGQHVTVSRHHRVADLDGDVLAVVGDADQDEDWYSGWELQRPSLFR